MPADGSSLPYTKGAETSARPVPEEQLLSRLYDSTRIQKVSFWLGRNNQFDQVGDRHVRVGSRAAVSGRLMAQPIYPPLQLDRTPRSCPKFALPGHQESSV